MKWVRKIGYVFFLILFLIFILGPFLWAFLLSITPEYAMFTNHLSLLPKEVTWENYKALFLGTSRQGQLLFQGMWNSIRAIIVTFCIGFPIAILSAYVLCRMEFKGKNVIKNCLLNTENGYLKKSDVLCKQAKIKMKAYRYLQERSAKCD